MNTLWQRYQDWLYYHEGLELYLDVSRMRFDEVLHPIGSSTLAVSRV